MPTNQKINHYFNNIITEFKKFPTGLSKEFSSDYSDDKASIFRFNFNSVGDIKIFGWLVYPNEGEWKGAILQFPAYAQVLFPLMDFVDLGIVTMAVSVRGHHGSDKQVSPGFPGLLTWGLPDEDTYIYRQMFFDVLRAYKELTFLLEKCLPIIAIGRSQGAALSLLLAAYCNEIIGVSAEVPWLCSIKESLKITKGFPYKELQDYIRDNPKIEDQILSTISYFDICNHAHLINCPVLLGLGTEDPVTPISSTRKLSSLLKFSKTYEYQNAGHEGGGIRFRKLQSLWIEDLIINYQRNNLDNNQ